MKFNKSQQQALDSNVSTIISAGAGSGKTAVLTEKVYRLIDEGVIDTNNLLVLTFTNAAAYSMKMKIIKNFKEKNSPFQNKVVSAHIQTYDSFSLDLVKKYAFELGINPNINIVNQAIISSKVKDFINEVIDKKYENSEEKVRYSIHYLCFNGDQNLRNLIYDIYEALSSFTPDSRSNFINNYEDLYLNQDRLQEEFNSILFGNFLMQLINDLQAFLLKYEIPLLNPLKEKLNEITLDEKNSKLILENTDYSIYDFATFILNFLSKITKKTNEVKNLEFNDEFIADKKKITDFIKKYYDYLNIDNQINLLLKQKPIIDLIFEVIKEVDEKISSYKKLTSSYTFADIANLSLSLLKDEKYKDIKKEIKDTYKFILVDEYQDTNDIQEEFINELIEGTDNKLFVVGDVKQSIYGFRNANPSLFIARRKKYKEDNQNSCSIDMNTNYRSIKKILDDINKYCEANMSLEHGNIEFNESEKLIYDLDTDLYCYKELENNKNSQYGISVLIPTSLPYQAERFDINYPYIYAIAKDIINKINNKYQVIDEVKDGVIKYRDVTFKDFAILTRTGYSYQDFREVFEKFNIPLNLVFDSEYRNEIIIEVIENIIKFTLAYLNNDESNYPHYFMSLARSYLYEYNDEKIFNILFTLDNNNRIDNVQRIKNIKNSDVYLNIVDFANNVISKNENISSIFNKLISYFKIIEKLDKLGNIENNINVIEVFYSIVNSLDNASTSLEGLALMLKSLTDNKIELKGSTVVENNNAVTLETMHKSKGLEYKIVYIPFNEASYSNKAKKPLVDKKYGLFIKNSYEFGTPKFNYLYNVKYESNKKEDSDEFERIIYVALTRAKESLILVDNFKKPDKGLLVEYYKAYKRHIEFNDELFNLPVLKDDLLTSIVKDFKVVIDFYNSLVLNDEAKIKDILTKFSDEDLIENLNTLAKDLLNFKRTNGISKSLLKDLDYETLKATDGLKKTILEDLYELITHGANYIFGYVYKLLIPKTGEIKFTFLPSELQNKKYLKNFLNNYNNLVKDDSKKFQFDITNPINYFVLEKIVLPILGIDLDVKPILIFYPVDSYYELSSLKDEIKPLEQLEKKDEIEVEEVYSKLRTTNKIYEFKDKVNKRASHKVDKNLSLDKEIVEDPNQGKLNKGILYHKILELFDFKKQDYTFIKDENVKKLIKNIVSLDILSDVKDADIYKEYQYLIDGQEGIIDLLLVYKDKIKIIDYKTKNIDDEAYNRQLNVYRSNIEKLFGSKDIKMYLFSIVDGTYKEVSKEEV